MPEEPSESVSVNEAVYLSHRQSLVALGDDQLKTFDRAILGLSSGALGLSIVFVKDIAGVGVSHAHWALMASWSLYLVAIVTNVWSYYLSWKDCQFEIAVLDKCFATSTAAGKLGDNKYRRITMLLNKLALACFMCATVILAFFAFQNV